MRLSEEEREPANRDSVRCKVLLGFTSDLTSSGIRDIIRFLVQHRMVDVVVTTAGGVEEDLVKCLAPTYRGEFSLPGAVLSSKGLNRIGNLLVPNGNNCKFEDWIIPIFDQMLDEQNSQNVLWTPSKVIARLGKEINNESSYLYWAYKNNIPVYCPSLTDGSLGVIQALVQMKQCLGGNFEVLPRQLRCTVMQPLLSRCSLLKHLLRRDLLKEALEYMILGWSLPRPI
ncbi:hypothetical protein SASPL_112942 [Salvia splendens]|uniref:Deoxyhypusine synthase n=1 Tax=Salvia splendens TaxID=180675 RepID=A0A8X8YBQ3_SALSN|nr:hypothetical protein SASPL_112942 [Salvia splendens]